jgi:hypothetical protein
MNNTPSEPNSLLPALRASLQRAVETRYGVKFSRLEYNICDREQCKDPRPAYLVFIGPDHILGGYFHPGCYILTQQQEV